MLWFLMTGQIPTEEQTRQLSRELAERGELPKYAEQLIDS
jgi:citrate synthase